MRTLTMRVIMVSALMMAMTAHAHNNHAIKVMPFAFLQEGQICTDKHFVKGQKYHFTLKNNQGDHITLQSSNVSYALSYPDGKYLILGGDQASDVLVNLFDAGRYILTITKDGMGKICLTPSWS